MSYDPENYTPRPATPRQGAQAAGGASDEESPPLGCSSCAALRQALSVLVKAVERDDNPYDQGHPHYSDEMNAARDLLGWKRL